MDIKFNGKKIKLASFMLEDKVSFLNPTKETELVYNVDYRGEYELCWICTIEKETGKEIKRSSDKNVLEIIWDD